jgi:parallel beta-helix repeat protein
MNDPQTVSVDLEVIGPIIGLSQTSFNFKAEENGTDPDDQIFTITNTGGTILNWQITETCDWLIATPNSGTSIGESDDVTLSVDITGLTNGLYTCGLTITDPCAMNSPQTVNVYLGIGPDVPYQYPTIQAAIDVAINGDTIVVAPGTYYENINFNEKNIVLTSIDPTDTNIVAATIIDAGGSGKVVTLSSSQTSACELTGFTITNGYTSGVGGGICGYGTTATISECIITGNTANEDGGGIYYCNGVITNCTIAGNTVYDDGGGLYYCNGSITNCTITDNTASYGGGLLYCNGTITNCTITDNSATRYGGGLYNCDGAITNCIIWNNSAIRDGDQLIESSTPTYTCIHGWTEGGTGNINSNPDFVGDGNYHLQFGSPCIDAGTNSPPGGLPETDMDGNHRIINAVVDMGAYETIPPSTEATMNFTSTTLNCSSEGNWIKAHFILPEGYLIEDVDTDKPATIDSLTILSDHMNAFINDEGFVEIEIAFSRNDFCSIGLFGNVDLTVRGWLIGQTFYGTDTIRITTNQLEKLPEFLSHWLQTNCLEPDFCNGFDLDQNGTVNLADFVLLAEN